MSGRIRRVARRQEKEDLLLELIGDLPADPMLPAITVAGRAVPLTDAAVWLCAALRTGQLPDRDELDDVRRALESGGIAAARWPRSRAVDVVLDGVVVDAHHTVHSRLATGIQRVVRATLSRWDEDHSFHLVSWVAGFHTLRAEVAGAYAVDVPAGAGPAVPVVPWRGVLVLPELAIEAPRLARLRLLAEVTPVRCAAIGYDCVPMTSAETTGGGMPGAFAANLATLARFDVVAAISESATREYLGWTRMLPSAGLAGPTMVAVPLPVVGFAPSADAAPSARPLVLCVGSHEPRKNHGSVLYAAELLWQEGREFELVFVGGNAWGADAVLRRIAALRRAGRPVSTRSAVSDGELARLYERARFTVFPSLNEGFGLPVAESLASGVPVITSEFGSMREIAEPGGALLIDARDDEALVRAMRLLLDDDDEHARLAAAARGRRLGSWEAYASRLWEVLATSGSPAERG